MTTKDAIEHLQKVLKKDKEYRDTWHANLSMAVIDNYHWYKGKNKNTKLTYNDLVAIANNSAEYFLKQLCDELQVPKGR